MDGRLRRAQQLGRLLLLTLAVAGAAAGLVVAAGACSNTASGGGGVPGCPDIQFLDTCPSPPPSWKNEVQQLVVKYCDQCHGSGGVAAVQVPLATYQDVFDNRTRSWEQIYKCAMPNTDASLPAMAFPTADERQTMVNWLDVCGAPNN